MAIKKYSKILAPLAIAAALAIPAAAGAAPGSTGVSTNGTTSDAIGFCVSAGNYNYLNGVDPSFTTTGQDRSSYAGTPGAVAALIAGARTPCASLETPYPPPGQ
jgi:hypothetical protein